MKKQICLIILLLTCRICSAQNLVPNGDFEQYTNCPYAGQIDSCLFWTNPTWGNPNYYNQCTSWNYGVPSNWGGSGYQFAHSGGAYCGIKLKYVVPPVDSQRDYIEVPLISTLIPNQCYHFEMYVNLINASTYTTDAIGVYFSDTLVTGVNDTHRLPFIPQIENNAGNFFDTLSWTLVSGNFIASGGENYLIIGNFKSEAIMTLVQLNSQLFELIVYIDDVSLSPCTSINELDEIEAINISPNPFNDKLTFRSMNGEPSEIILYDIASRKLLQQKFTNSVSLNTEQLTKGLYLYEVRSKDGSYKKGKVVKD